MRRKASDRILDTFIPTQKQYQVATGTTIQILNAIPLPEVSAIDGKNSPVIQIAGRPVSVPRKFISAGDDPDAKSRRASFLGPAAMDSKGKPTGTGSPMPEMKQTDMPKKPS